jgi:hypothetical protein
VGQPIQVLDRVVIGEVALFDTDRTLTGQDGETYTTGADSEASSFGAAIAARLLDSDDRLDEVYVLSNTLSLRRSEGWTEESLDNAAETIRTFFIFYDENKAPGAMDEPEPEAAEEVVTEEPAGDR